jgi:hypothetical protein
MQEEIQMKRLSVVAAGLLVAGVAVVSFTHQSSGQADAGWITLFDGTNLDQWSPIGDANWNIADGAVQADKGNGFLVSKNAYTDYQIRAEFYVDTASNSGIFIRCADPAKVTAENCYEVNIWDSRPDPSYGTGAIVNLAKPTTYLKAGGKWNNYEITAKGPSFTVVLNGTRTVDGVQDAKLPSGRVALQYGGGGVVKFRKVQIKPM